MEHLSSFSAEELNDAIDSRNFPRHGSISDNGAAPAASTSPPSDQESSTALGENGENGVAVVKEHVNGFSKWANRPKPLDLKSAEKIFNVPGSSQTPRTSTTPGRSESHGPKLFRTNVSTSADKR